MGHLSCGVLIQKYNVTTNSQIVNASAGYNSMAKTRLDETCTIVDVRLPQLSCFHCGRQRVVAGLGGNSRSSRESGEVNLDCVQFGIIYYNGAALMFDA